MKDKIELASFQSTPCTALLLIVIFYWMLFMKSCSVVKNPSPLDNAQTKIYPVTVQDYRIQAGDQLDIKFFYNPELNESLTVRPDGRISLQLANEIMAYGLTPAELTKVLKEKYSTELDNPEVTVIVRSFSAQKVYVDGEVAKPGVVPLTGSMTLLQAMSQAGGVKDTAKTSEVVIMRRISENKFNIYAVNVNKVIDGTDMSQDLPLMPFDIIYVPRTVIADLDIFVDQYLRKMLPISTGLTYNLYKGVQ
ncbi:MAG: polysaccharide biosynthesis/export family protein [Dissulfurispiraceae bacterium]